MLCEELNPGNINPMPAVKFSARGDLRAIILSLDGHSLTTDTLILTKNRPDWQRLKPDVRKKGCHRNRALFVPGDDNNVDLPDKSA